MSKKSGQLTEVELEMMNILWKKQRATVREVLAELPPERPMAYTTASTIIRILEQKKIVRSEKAGKAHVYVPTLAKEDYSISSLEHLVSNIYEGAPTQLIRQLISSQKLSVKEKAEIKKIIDEELK